MTAPPKSGRLARWRFLLTSVEAAAGAGVVFAALYIASLALARQGIASWEEDPPTITEQIAAAEGRASLLAGYVLAPFAAIAFAWFVAVVRWHIPPEGRFVTTVFVSAATIFVALYLVAFSVVAGPFYIEAQEGVSILRPETLLSLQAVAYGLLFVVVPRIQVLVILAATAVGRYHKVFPRWLVIVGFVIAVIQLVNFTFFEPLLFLFPLWVAAVGVTLLVRRTRLTEAEPDPMPEDMSSG